MTRPVGGGDRRQVILLNGVAYRVARDPQSGAPLWKRERAPATWDDLIPFRETVSFGFLGLGGSDPSLRGCYDYALDVDTETWDQLAPGPLRQRLNLALPQPPRAIASVRSTGNQTLTYTSPTGSDEGTSWTAPGNIGAPDSTYATFTTGLEPSSWLRATNWGISGLTTLLGIQVDVKCKTNGAEAPLSLQLVDSAGTPVGQTKLLTVTGTEQYLSAGGPTDLWGTNLVPANLQSTSFGVRLRVEATPGTLYANSVVSAGSWINSQNALGAPNTAVANATVAPSGVTSELILGYGFPSGAYAGTVTVTVRLRSNGGPYYVICRLYESGTLLSFQQSGIVAYTALTDVTFTFSNMTFTDIANLRVGVYFNNQDTVSRTYYVDSLQVNAGLQNVLVSIDHVRLLVTTGTQTRKLYVGGGAQLVKLDLGSLSPDSSITFTHGEPNMAPAITDIVAVKDGADPYGVAPGGLQGPVLAVCFGQTAQIQQINAVATSGADTYQTLSATKAFASAMAVTMSPDNTQVLVWRSAPAGSGSSAFSKIKQAAVPATLVDLTNDSTWTPTNGYQMGDIAESISGMTEYARGLVVGKPSGVYTVDDRFSPYLLFGTRAYRHEDNCRRLFAWGTKLLIPTTQDLAAIPGGADPFIGLSRLVANRSPVRGYPTAMASFGRYVYVAFYDGTDSWICKGRLSQGEVPWPVIWHSLVRVPNHKVLVMHVTDDGKNGPVRLFYSVANTSPAGTYDLEYLVIDPRGTPRLHQSGGQVYTQRFGVLTKRQIVRRVHTYAQGVSAGSYWTVDISMDGGAWQPVGTVTQNGRVTLDIPGGVSGYVGQLRLTCTLASASDRPLLLGSTSEQQGPGGVVVEGYRQADEVERFQIQVRVGQEMVLAGGGRQTRAPAKVLSDLAALLGRTTTLVAEDLFGDRTPRTVVLQAAEEVPTGQEGELPAERTVQLRGYVLP